MAIEQFERSILLVRATAFLFALGGQAALADDHGAGADIRTVDCAKPNASVQRKIDRATQGTPTTIVIKGTCTEDIVVRKDDLTLLAHPAGSGTVEGSIDVVGAQRVTIDGLRVISSGDAVTVRDNASVTIHDSEIESKTNFSTAVFAVRLASVVLVKSLIEASGKKGCAVFISDGAVLRLNDGNTLVNDDDGFDCATLSVYRNSSARIRGSGNTISNKGDVKGGPDSGNAGGFALDSEHVSSLRIDGSGAAIVNGNVSSFNLSTIDLRKVVINGGIYADGLNSNIRLRGNRDNDVIVNGDVFPGGDSAVAIRNKGEVVINGNIDCSNGESVRADFKFFGPVVEGGPLGTYLNCSFFPPPP